MDSTTQPQARVRKGASLPRDFRIGSVDVHPGSGRVTGPGGSRQLDLKVMDVLVRLAVEGGQVVSKIDLMEDVWTDTVVTDFALSRCIYQLRKNLGEVAQTQESPIETLPKRGYRLTWPVEETGLEQVAGTKRHWSLWVMTAIVMLAVAGIATWQAWNPFSRQESRPAIAVLPFTDLTPAGELAYFGDGVAQTLLNELGHIKEIDVIARHSSFRFRGAETSVDNIAAALGVGYLVEGSVDREANTVHVSAALVDVGNGRRVWSQTFQSIAGRSFSVQRDIAAKIAGYLEMSLGDPRSHGGTDSYEAFEAYLRATESEDMEVAGVFIDEALAHDGDYALALVAKAHFNYVRLWQGVGSEQDTWTKAGPLLERALSITDELPYAHVLVAGFQILREDYQPAELALQRALEINPSHTQAFVHLSRLMERTGRVREAVVLAERNVHLDPLNSFRHLQLANRRWTAGDIEGGKADFQRALELDPLNYAAWRDYAYRLADHESPVEGFRLVARLQRNPDFRSRFSGAVPKISPSGVQLFGLWFGFIGDFKREREMLRLQFQMADNARLHRELGWALLGEGDLDAARSEAWIALGGMARESIVNFQVAYIALRTGKGLNDVLAHYREYWPGLFSEPPAPESVPKMVTIGAALIHRVQGDEQRAVRLLNWLQDKGEDPFKAAAMALAHLDDFDAALDALESHVSRGGYFSYLPGDPFWAPLADQPRFMTLVESLAVEAAAMRAQVNAMIESGTLILPGHIDS